MEMSQWIPQMSDWCQRYVSSGLVGIEAKVVTATSERWGSYNQE